MDFGYKEDKNEIEFGGALFLRNCAQRFHRLSDAANDKLAYEASVSAEFSALKSQFSKTSTETLSSQANDKSAIVVKLKEFYKTSPITTQITRNTLYFQR